MVPSQNPFREYHRERRWMLSSRIAAAGVSAALVLGLVALVEPATTATDGERAAAAAAAIDAPGILSEKRSPAPDEAVGATPEPVAAAALPSPTSSAALPATAPLADPAAVSTGPPSWSIAIDTRGYQDEIDQCLWVRMDLGGQAPIVGAHNHCGGGVVLEMQLGDVVTLAGTELDGRYVVSDARDARAGDSAVAAIDGMAATVILQTCYWGGDGRVRLVGLTRAPGA